MTGVAGLLMAMALDFDVVTQMLGTFLHINGSQSLPDFLFIYLFIQIIQLTRKSNRQMDGLMDRGHFQLPTALRNVGTTKTSAPNVQV